MSYVTWIAIYFTNFCHEIFDGKIVLVHVKYMYST